MFDIQHVDFILYWDGSGASNFTCTLKVSSIGFK